MRDIVKSFVGVKANDGIDLDLQRGEVHTLLGENGAGKSTLMNILCGLYTPEKGRILIRGEEMTFRSPRDAIDAGIGMVHQHFMLVPAQSVWENVALGLRDLPFVPDKNEVIGRIESIREKYGIHVDPLAPVWQLSIGEQQRVALIKMLYRDAEILILDEPTAVLTPQESRALFSTVRQMVSEGHGIIFISHKLDEVLEVSDKITILRKGKKVATVPASRASKESLAEMMVGRKVVFQIGKTLQNPGRVVLETRDLFVRGDRGRMKVSGFSINVRKREILGLAGISGNGQEELCEALAGMRKTEGGGILVDGTSMEERETRDFQRRGIGYIPADRVGTGLVTGMNLRENIALRKYWRKEFTRFRFFVHWENIAGRTGQLVERFGVVNPGLGYPARMLSGGNLQKLMLARELSDDPKVVIAVQPTWGLDVSATQFVRETLLEQRDRGAAILLVSDDLDEILSMSDRIAVIHDGKLMGLVEHPDTVSEEQMGLMMAGSPLEEFEVPPDSERESTGKAVTLQ
ncbi:MAG TPA: ABC transporter ATP-binding protein [Synergistales bacterium]|jgi:simple sugar transport system ATP-binding protein|nr:ABC transporter ATP-binding protein [Synergistales bacterium]HRV70826.1 ABC transporter ATP-binding protein [Thermovirgaceae bacterium]